MRSYTLGYLLLLTSFFSYGQNSFSMGVKFGYGTSAFRMKPLLYSNDSTERVRSGSTLSTGVIGRYMIADQIGIESGAVFNHYSFYRDDDFRTRDRFWKTPAEVEVFNFQMPVIVNYKFKVPQRPFSYVILSAGTTIDWFFTDGFSRPTSYFRPQAVRNLLAGLKTGRERIKGKIELGIEIQYSFQHFHVAYEDHQQSENFLNSRLNIVSLSMGYFFFNKQRRSTTI